MCAAFTDLGLSPGMLRTIERLGYEQPTPIQVATIPLLLQGRDVIAEAQTGTGKTAAFSIPLVQRIEAGDLGTQALIVVPTRELAMQVAEAVHQLAGPRGPGVVPIYGGQPYDRQLRALKAGVPIVAGTPGRLLDHIRRGTFPLEGVRFLVLDEADEMLDMGFVEDIEFLIQQLPPQRQVALFSATIPRRVESLARRYFPDAQRVTIAQEAQAAPLTRHFFHETPYAGKFDALSLILDMEEPRSGMIFCRTKREVDEVAERLQARGYAATAIHGDIGQNQRERLLGAFRENRTDLLVATDVAARGLDIPDVTHVINYDIPQDADSYIHRVGRTGRMGRKGEAITFVTYREIPLLRAIERQIHRKLRRLRLPTPQDISARRLAGVTRSLRDLIEQGSSAEARAVVEQLAPQHDPLEIAAAAVQLALSPDAAVTTGGDGLQEAPQIEPRARTPRPAPGRDGRGRELPRGNVPARRRE